MVERRFGMERGRIGLWTVALAMGSLGCEPIGVSPPGEGSVKAGATQVGASAIRFASFTRDPDVCASTVCYEIEAIGRHDVSFVSVATIEACDDHIVDVTVDGESTEYELGRAGNPHCSNPHGVKVDQGIRRGDTVMLCITYDRIYTYDEAASTLFEVKAARSCETGELEGAVSCFDGEVCDGFDNNCDGMVDEGFDVGDACSVGVGECRRSGQTQCTPDGDDVVCSATPGEPMADDQCDGRDNDCDGDADEHYVPTESSCGVGACTRDGRMICDDGWLVDTCEPGAPADTDACNGVDDDCDGGVDEGFLSLTTSCGLGECRRSGMTVCEDGAVRDTCMPAPPAPSDDSCDGRDNDCDGMADEDYAPQMTFCGVGECAATGLTTCVDGSEGDTCEPGMPSRDDQCDGLDNDCDGRNDEHYVAPTTNCGVGECIRSGALSCVGGELADTCTPGSPAPDHQCDGLDNDCDGSADEHYVAPTTSCGVGECAAMGEWVCESGDLRDTCAPGAPTSDHQCDGLDNDCDGSADEHYVAPTTSCGVGECVQSGRLECDAGELADSCVPGTPAPDNQCDGRDNDCDGSADEHYVPVPTACGEGECAAMGEWVCEDGSRRDTCEPGTPTPDAQCDGLDNDCDGTPDDDYVPPETMCGVGECAAYGDLMCVDGSTGDTCTPGTPMAEMCNGLDDDCDGETDEELGQTSCGIGQCARTVDNCVEGTPRVCEPGLPGEEICNGLDDDCDGGDRRGPRPLIRHPATAGDGGSGRLHGALLRAGLRPDDDRDLLPDLE